MASSFEMGGLGEEIEEWMDVDDGAAALRGMHETW